MQSLLLLISIFFLVYLTHAAILKSPMTNDYPQIAVLGCDSRKANLYYDVDRHVWVEHLISSCVNNEQSILEFCQQAYPSLHIGNIVRLDTVLRFENWCELISPVDANGNNVHRCKKSNGLEEAVQPFRCLYMSSKREEITVPALDCSMNSIIGTGECFRPEKWQQLASIECANKSMSLNNSIMTLDWCGLSSFRGIEFVCCSSKKLTDNDYETSVDEQDASPLAEDDPILEPSASSHRRIIAMTLATREPNWMEDYRRWNTDSAYFADDEDTNDYQASSMIKSNEHERFKQDKEDFKRKYKEQINQLKSRWQSRQNEIQLLSNRNASAAQRQSASSEIEFRREYDFLKQSASRERTRINEVHEIHLDTAVNAAKNDANQKLIDAWNEKPLKTETIQEALYKYLQALLRDRIQLVNRYERLRAVDPEQAERKRVSIHERLRFIVERINNALNELRRHSNLQTKIQPRIDALFAEYDEVNQAAEKLLVSYAATSTVAAKIRLLPPLGRDEKRIYPFSTSTTSSAETNNEYDYATNDEYDEEEDEPERKSTSTRSPTTTAASTTTTTTTESEMINYDQVDTGDSDWDVQTDDDDDDDDTVAATANKDSTLDLKIDEQNQQAFINEHDTRPLVPNKRLVRQLFVTYLPYLVGCLFILCVLVGLLIFRFIRQNRSYRHKYEKNYLFTEIDSCSPEEKALHALQMNGYENPTYKFFESQTGKC